MYCSFKNLGLFGLILVACTIKTDEENLEDFNDSD